MNEVEKNNALVAVNLARLVKGELGGRIDESALVLKQGDRVVAEQPIAILQVSESPAVVLCFSICQVLLKELILIVKLGEAQGGKLVYCGHFADLDSINESMGQLKNTIVAKATALATPDDEDAPNPTIKIELDGVVYEWENYDFEGRRDRTLKTPKGKYELQGYGLQFSRPPHVLVADYTEDVATDSAVAEWVKAHYENA